jgi:hypothetical protein
MQPDQSQIEPSTPLNLIEYSRLSTPLKLVTNKEPTYVWDFSLIDAGTYKINAELSEKTAFLAYGKAVLVSDNTTFFMSESDFGNADVTRTPFHAIGISTIDLSAAPVPIEDVIQPNPVVTVNDTTLPVEPVLPDTTIEPTVATNTPAPESESVIVPVRVVPPDPLKWHKSFVSYLGPIDYVATTDKMVFDLNEELPAVKIIRGMTVSISGTFEKDTNRYYRTTAGMANDTWYGLPIDILNKKTELSEEQLDKILDNFHLLDEAPTPKDKIIKKVASADGFLSRIFRHSKDRGNV